MSQLTTLDELSQHITSLARVEESEAPFISAYFNLENGQDGWRETLDERARILRRILKGNDLADFEEVLGMIEAWLDTGLLPEAKGVAIFARGTFGGSFMLPMQFAAPLPNWVAVYPTPNIYHLVELKDNYHRYVVLLALADRVSIVEVNLGEATIQAWLNQAELRKRVGTGWVRSQYQNHRGDRFVHEKIAVLEKLMRAGGNSHLILAGDPEIAGRVRRALPRDVAKKQVDMVPASERDLPTEVVMLTIASFIAHEEQESRTDEERLIEGLRSQNLAVAGSSATLEALLWGKVDTLIMTNDYQPDPGWECTVCKSIGTELSETSVCQRCGEVSVRPLDIRAALLRLAGQSGRPVKVVEQSDALMTLGGVGCLLRTNFDTQTERTVAAG